MTIHRHLSSAVLTAGLAAVAVTASAPALAQVPSQAQRAAVDSREAAARSQISALPSSGLSTAEQARAAPRIVNGEPELEDGEWAWTVSVYVKMPTGRSVCGGALVKPSIPNGAEFVAGWVESTSDLNWVVTAAHCVTDKTGKPYDANSISVHAGKLWNDDQQRTEQAVEAFLIHDRYDPVTSDNDIALLRLSAPNGVVDGSVKRKSIRLASDLDALWLYDDYTALTVHGWGRTSEGGFLSEFLQKLRVPLVNRDACDAAYSALGHSISNSMMCAGFSSGGYDSCAGDSGGPIAFIPAKSVANPVSSPVLAGVVSWGVGCARQNAYGVYANVLTLRPWLEKAAVKLDP